MSSNQHAPHPSDKNKLQLNYLWPNLLTTGGLFAGYYAIISAMNGYFTQAAVSIFIAMLLDGLDGRLARLTGSSSKFGEQYDSLADAVSFGIAPALVSFSWALHNLGKIGWAISFIYAAAAALRLARFNCQLNTPTNNKKYFIGLPSPAAAGSVAGLIWASEYFSIQPDLYMSFFSSIFIALMGVLMVSNVSYYSFKEINVKKKIPFLVIFIIAVTYALIAANPAICLFTIFTIYSLSGICLNTWKKLKSLCKFNKVDKKNI